MADVGPRGHVGEGSAALARALGINPDPRHGGVDSGVRVILLPGSRHARKMSADEIATEGAAALAAAGCP